jgi:hypothetical protein
MKKLILSLVAIATISLSSLGQAPEGFKYQAVVRDAGNTILNNQAVGMRMTIQQGSIGGTTVYQETFSPTTNAYGLVNLEIGNGTVVSGTFANIDWANGPFYIETAVDLAGGTAYTVLGTSQLMSVPYALYAKTSGSSTPGPQGPQGIPGSQDAWSLTGNAGTNPLSNFIGTTDAQDVVVKTNGVERMRVLSSQGLVGIGTSNPSLPLEVTTANGGTSGAIKIVRNNSTQNRSVTLDFDLKNNSNQQFKYAAITGGISENIAGQEEGFITLQVADGTGNWGVFYEQEKIRITNERTSLKNLLNLQPQPTPPNNPIQGDIYFDSSINKLRVYDGTTWQNCW